MPSDGHALAELMDRLVYSEGARQIKTYSQYSLVDCSVDSSSASPHLKYMSVKDWWGKSKVTKGRCWCIYLNYCNPLTQPSSAKRGGGRVANRVQPARSRMAGICNVLKSISHRPGVIPLPVPHTFVVSIVLTNKLL